MLLFGQIIQAIFGNNQSIHKKLWNWVHKHYKSALKALHLLLKPFKMACAQRVNTKSTQSVPASPTNAKVKYNELDVTVLVQIHV